MKRIITICAAILMTANVFAQSPQKMSYQAVIRDASYALVVNETVGMQISILQGSAIGTAVYVETQTPTSNANGLVSLEVGAGTVVSGTFASINWGNGPYFIKTETDPTGGTNYTIAGTNELMSVPYALFSANGTPGPAGTNGTNGTNGTDGQGAYEVAVANGFVGTETQWLASLQGTAGTNGTNGTAGINGTNGTNGQSAYEVAVANGFVGTETQWLASLQGTAGTNGANGTDGTNGTNGTDGQVGGFTHYLGEAFNGGIIFYLYKGSDGLEHGLIVALTESIAAWQTTGTLVNANRTEDGAYNTTLMTGSPAATYITGLGAGWYLPSIDELGLLFYNRYSAHKGLRAGGHTLLLNYTYWSSTEFDATAAYAMSCGNFCGTVEKTDGTSVFVRGVRAF